MGERKNEPAIVCRCMDVTYEEMVKAFEIMRELLGTADVDTYRRISSATTGYCQGRACMQHLQRILFSKSREKGLEASAEKLIPKRRPPLQPTPIGVFARIELKGD